MPDKTLTDQFPDAVAAYERAKADAAYARAEWVKAKRPIVVDHGKGSAGVHPLFKSVGEA